jgi:euchromatic histone-lysine N-methyltransferase
MVIAGAAAAPCRPRSARYAEKGYPSYKELDGRRAPRWRNDGGGRAKNLESWRGRKRGRGVSAEAAAAAAVKVEPAILQVEEAVAQEHGRKRRMTGAAPSVTAVGKAFPLIEDAEEEVASTDGGADKRGGVGKCWRLRVKETLRAFSRNYLHFVQVPSFC